MDRRSPKDTIAAIATPPGEGGIGILRLSGPDSISIAHSIFTSSRGRDIRTARGRVFHGEIRDAHGTIDEVLVHIMRAPHSYTAEDVVEINCHGGAAPIRAVLELVLSRSARLATPGEFTKRAFLNGRIDLIQAEAVIDRIRAQTDAALRAASSAAEGVLSKSLHEISEVLIEALARVESAIDFPDDDLPELVDAALRARLDQVLAKMRELIDTAERGRLYREGASVAIVGRPNVGKSSLFNALLRDARAIVTSVPGTTRDLLEEVITIDGVPIRLSDTAGLRATDDEVEQIGIGRARAALLNADIVMLVVDVSEELTTEDHELIREVNELRRPTIVATNKIDLAPQRPLNREKINHDWETCQVSAKTEKGLKELESAIGRKLLGGAQTATDQGIITRMHQRDSLRRAAEALAHTLANYGASPEFLSIDLRDAIDAIGEITGETTPEDVLDRIFSSFCIGK
ncbi:MAG: tRNA uridine-5-carboxymethylaminomethyl(34) synthesis GTPase MnmE [Candidatus Hydrogenedentes bacterium]|nr:tRNA uridine-5-carboxymethylaminomethyl(34) synthesis GTPase MnmE [Candidatus Hydrogenedentota bacterium]